VALALPLPLPLVVIVDAPIDDVGLSCGITNIISVGIFEGTTLSSL
jgi:hypothetical protein